MIKSVSVFMSVCNNAYMGVFCRAAFVNVFTIVQLELSGYKRVFILLSKNRTRHLFVSPARTDDSYR